MLSHLDTVQNDYVKHQEKIYDKCVSMVVEVLDGAVKELMTDKSWINDLRTKSPSKYIENVHGVCMQVWMNL
jgi:hypothetical protein